MPAHSSQEQALDVGLLPLNLMENEMATNNLMKYFKYDHLPPKLQEVSKKFAELAEYIDGNIPQSAESTVALRKLLEAKDCAVRASLEMNG